MDTEALKRYGADFWKVISHPAWYLTIVLCTVGVAATSMTSVRAKWPMGRVIFVGALGTGLAFGVLAPLFPPLGRDVATAATVAQVSAPPQPRSRSALNKTFEPAQGTESAGVFVGQ